MMASEETFIAARQGWGNRKWKNIFVVAVANRVGVGIGIGIESALECGAEQDVLEVCGALPAEENAKALLEPDRGHADETWTAWICY